MAKGKTRRERRTFNDEYKQQVLELVRDGASAGTLSIDARGKTQ